MNHRRDFHLRWMLMLAVGMWAGGTSSMAQQTPAATPPAVPANKNPVALDAGPVSSQADGDGTAIDMQTPILRTTTRRVLLDVVVTGTDGRPVPNLSQQDFTVFEDHKQQSVRGFEAHNPELDQNPLPPIPAQLHSHTFMNLEKTPASGPAVIVLLDFLNTQPADQSYAHEQILRFLERKPASLQVAIVTLSDKLRLLQGFTTDTEKLVSAMRSRAAGPALTANSEPTQKAQTTLDAFLDLGRFLASMDGRKNLLWFSGSFDSLTLPQARDVDSGMILLNGGSDASSVQGSGRAQGPANVQPSVPGNLNSGDSAASYGVGLDAGDRAVLQDRMRKVAAALALSQTAVYPIDVRGLAVDPGMSAAASGAQGDLTAASAQQTAPGIPGAPGHVPTFVQNRLDFMQSLSATQATMQQIAEATGGRAFVNTNGIALAADEAVTAGSSYYTLVYAPSNRNFDGGLRSIHVALDKPGCHLSYRSAYYADDPAEIAPNASGTLAAAMEHGAPDSQSLVFKAQIDPDGPPVHAPSGSPLAAKAEYHSAKKLSYLSGMIQAYSIQLAILAPQLKMAEAQDGRYHAALEVAVYGYAADGQRLGGSYQKLEAALSPRAYQTALEAGFYHNLAVDLPVEAASLRLGIRDRANRHAGSLEIPLPLAAADTAAKSEQSQKPLE